eukprot:TRINITY_DN103832_c0_g1_i1.p1 TRINITY_DN103832_c0_g1~~TRINITY_DN103832_c0_g1_i1.p1  ORF type:complete len:483 (+),score=115.52 TRINITY_DN103832_c0_g1_i1:76-1524(+)
MAGNRAMQDRIDPKVLAALVNRFVADSADFLQGFARQAEAKLLTLSQRIDRLERLIILFERKVQHLEPAAGASHRQAASRSVGEAGASVTEAPLETLGSKPADPAASACGREEQASSSTGVTQGPFDDGKYAVYKRMHRTGVPLGAIRQKLLLDALEDSSLDVSILDSLDGSAGAGAGAPLRPATLAPTAVPPLAATPAEIPSATAESTADAAEPDRIAAPPPATTASPMNLAAAAAAAAQRRLSTTSAAKSGAEATTQMTSSSEPDEPRAAPTPVADCAGGPAGLAAAVAASAQRRALALAGQGSGSAGQAAPTSASTTAPAVPAAAQPAASCGGLQGLSSAGQAAPASASITAPVVPAAAKTAASCGGLFAKPSEEVREITAPKSSLPPPPPPSKATPLAAMQTLAASESSLGKPSAEAPDSSRPLPQLPLKMSSKAPMSSRAPPPVPSRPRAQTMQARLAIQRKMTARDENDQSDIDEF